MQIIEFIQSILGKSSPDMNMNMNMSLNNLFSKPLELLHKVLPASLFQSINIPLPSINIINISTSSSITTIFWEYLHFTPFIIILWPFLLTLLFSLTSASTWVFWLFTSLIFGLIQLIYVLYQFVMISIDLGVLSVLKTYTSMRSFVRYYTIRSGYIVKRKRHTTGGMGDIMEDDMNDDGGQYVNKRGRKREWRKKLDAAKSLRDFLQIEIQEPPPSSLDLTHLKTKTQNNNNDDDDDTHVSVHNKNKMSPLSSSVPPSSSSALSLLSKSSSSSPIKRRLMMNRFTSNDDINLTPSIPKRFSSSTAIVSHKTSTNTNDNINKNNTLSLSSSSVSSFPRSQSSIGFNNHNQNHNHNHDRTRPSSSSSSIIINRDEIEKELGMTGSMLIQTTCRLKETRMQASSTYTYQNGGSGSSRSSKYLWLLRQQQQQQQVFYEGGSGISNGISRSVSRDSIRELGEVEEDNDDNDNDQEKNNETLTSNHETNNDDADDDDDHNNDNPNSTCTSPTLQQPQTQQPQPQQENNAASQLKFLLQGVVKRNHLSINKLLIQDALSVMECGRHHLSEQSRSVILSYHEEVEHCLKWISQVGLEKQYYLNFGHVNTHNGGAGSSSNSNNGYGNGADIEDSVPMNKDMNNSSHNNNNNNAEMKLYKELSDRLNLIRKLKHNMGRTALMLSGGGAQAMYHLGTIKALCESKLYDDIGVISGTSGGSITAAMCAIKTRSELLKDICVPHVSTDYGLTGEMKEKDIRWFPRVVTMGEYWLKHKLLVDSKEFKRCCDFYFGDITFEEAFERTGKHVCITVSASRTEESSGGGGGGEGGDGQRLLLNHISTPHVTLASAVAASCALPGVMAPAKLVTKNSDSKQELFEVDGVEWIDGSVQADLPFKRISTLFNVSNYIVCQTNFHVLPFLHKAHHPNTKSFYWRAFQTCEWDIRNRALNLSRLGLFPKIFGQDISKVFKQKYHGDLTLLPRFTTMQVFGLKALVNPTYEDMEVYLQNGQSSAWPYLSVIREMLRLETAIDKCIKGLNEKIDHLSPESDWDDVESFTSATTSRYRTLGARRENELLKQKVHSLELENLDMKKQLELMQKQFGIKVAGSELEELHPISTPTGQIEFVRSEQSLASEKKNRRRLWKKE